MHQFVTSGGKLHGLLAVNVPYALIYNRDLYQAAGVAKAPTSQEEYIQVAKRLTKRPDQFGHAARNTMPEQNGWWQDISHWVMGYGGQWVKAKKPQLTEAPVINAIKAYKRLYDDAVPQGADASTYRRMAWEGKIAQYIDNSANINILKSGNPAIYPKIFTARRPGRTTARSTSRTTSASTRAPPRSRPRPPSSSSCTGRRTSSSSWRQPSTSIRRTTARCARPT